MQRSKERDDGGPAFGGTWDEVLVPEEAMKIMRERGFPKGEAVAAFKLERRSSGMSLRDYFASRALSGMHARDQFDDGLATPEQRARIAYLDADAMLKARKEDR